MAASSRLYAALRHTGWVWHTIAERQVRVPVSWMSRSSAANLCRTPTEESHADDEPYRRLEFDRTRR